MVGAPGSANDADLPALLEFIRESRGVDFAGYKSGSVTRRVRKRMGEVGIDSMARYRDHLEVHPEEFVALFDTLLINVTGFFRDTDAWTYLAEHAIRELLANKDPAEPVRAWTAGCATGEETYSLAMVLAQALGLEEFRRRVKIYATEIDEDALSRARAASYTAKDLEPVPPALRDTFFEMSGTRFSFRSDLRRAVIFGRHDLLEDPPMSRIDVITCRNTLMYFNADRQRRVLERFAFGLGDRGILFLGKSEMLLTHGDLFTPIELTHRVFRRTEKHRQVVGQTAAGAAIQADALQRIILLREAAFDVAPIAQVVVDKDGILVIANGAARRTFALSERDVGQRFQDLEVSYRPLELRSLIERCYEERRSIIATDVVRHLPDGRVESFEVTVEPLVPDSDTPLGVLVAFEDVTAHTALREDVERSRQELETSYEELQSTNEELETTNEELQSTVEELETTNEELQSTNEELESMNEELQSTNAELAAANIEVTRRTREVTEANEFLGSILGGLTIGVVVLDPDLTVVVWNEGTSHLWGLRAEEVTGRSFLSLEIGLPVDEVARPIRECLAGADRRDVTLDATIRTGRAIRCHVIARPQRAAGGGISGVVITMNAVEPSEP